MFVKIVSILHLKNLILKNIYKPKKHKNRNLEIAGNEKVAKVAEKPPFCDCDAIT